MSALKFKPTKSMDDKLDHAAPDSKPNTPNQDKPENKPEASPAVEKKVLERMRIMREHGLVAELIPIRSGLERDDLDALQDMVKKYNRNIDKRKERRMTQEILIAKYVVECLKREKNKFEK